MAGGMHQSRQRNTTETRFSEQVKFIQRACAAKAEHMQGRGQQLFPGDVVLLSGPEVWKIIVKAHLPHPTGKNRKATVCTFVTCCNPLFVAAVVVPLFRSSDHLLLNCNVYVTFSQKTKGVATWDGLMKWVSMVYKLTPNLGRIFEPFDERHIFSEKPFKENAGGLQQASCKQLYKWISQLSTEEEASGIKTTVAAVSKFMRGLKRRQAVWAHLMDPEAPIHKSQRMFSVHILNATGALFG